MKNNRVEQMAKMFEDNKRVHKAKTNTIEDAREYLNTTYSGRKVAFVDNTPDTDIASMIIEKLLEPKDDWGMLIGAYDTGKPLKLALSENDLTPSGIEDSIQEVLVKHMELEENLPIEYVDDIEDRTVVMRNRLFTITELSLTDRAVLLELKI